MAKAFKRLIRVLKLEADQGYQNKAVVGGIRQFATFWVSQAREEAVDEADRVLIEQIAEVLVDYGKMPGVEARATAIDSLISRLDVREERVKDMVPAAPSPSSVSRSEKAAEKPTKKPEPTKVEPRPEPEMVVAPDPEALYQPVSIIH
jgi:ATP-dependent DNA helicase RecG